jgi:hypothetical protein
MARRYLGDRLVGTQCGIVKQVHKAVIRRRMRVELLQPAPDLGEFPQKSQALLRAFGSSSNR